MGEDYPSNSQRDDQYLRDQLEKAYEEEKAKSVIVKKCARIYHEIL